MAQQRSLKGCVPTASVPTGTVRMADWGHANNELRVTKNFTVGELACSCCRVVILHYAANEALQKFRDLCRKPVQVTSGTRCLKKNASLKGAHPNSGHLYGTDFDVKVRIANVEGVKEAAKLAGFTRIKYYPKTGHYHLGL